MPGEDLPFVAKSYDRPEDFSGERVVVVGGGRSADWAATELYDAGKQVYYVMRQPFENHWRLINDSRYGLPYYARLAEIMESRDPRFQTLYQSHICEIEEGTSAGLVTVDHQSEKQVIEAEHVVMEIGGSADYSPFEGFEPLEQVEKYDNYRFQLHQVMTHPHKLRGGQYPEPLYGRLSCIRHWVSSHCHARNNLRNCWGYPSKRGIYQ